MAAHTVSSTEAQAHFSELLSQVLQHHQPVTILEEGRAVAQLVPYPQHAVAPLRGAMAGTGRELGDIVAPYQDEWFLNDAQ